MTTLQRCLWVRRLFEYTFRYYAIELPRGLDFSKRCRDKKTDPYSTGYALTSASALRNILNGVQITSDSSLIDVGGGKAGVAVFALSLGFHKTASLEFEESLNKIARKNIAVLGLEKNIELIHADAYSFKRYPEFSHIFMFNPVIGDRLKILIQNISDVFASSIRRHAEYTFIFYGGIPLDYVKQNLMQPLLALGASTKLIKNEICPFRGNEIRIVNAKFQ